jgi:hypothetical protein
MNRNDVCILLNSTPKYYYMLPLQMTMLRRYAPQIKWSVYFSTEEPNHPIARQLVKEFDVKIIIVPKDLAGFLESRNFAVQNLPSDIAYVLPLQEDFLLDRAPDIAALVDAIFILDTDRYVSSLRLNPCPGPHDTDMLYNKEKKWRILGQKNIYIFTYQATLWRRLDLNIYYTSLFAKVRKDFPNKKLSFDEMKYLALTSNIGEARYGQDVLKSCLPDTLHLSCPRLGNWSNAVYLCPWPYRPTAVTRGALEPFAEELFKREGVPYEKPDVNMMN